MTDVNMADDDIDTPEIAEVPRPRRRYVTRRHAALSGGALAILVVLLSVLSVVFYRYGIFDNYVKAEFVSNLADMNIVFTADVFRVTVDPLELELKNATFNDRVSGEKLFSIRDAQLQFTVNNLFAWQLSRDISIDKTEINGAEVWVKFDENGRSNFANVKFIEREGPETVNFKYQSVDFVLRDGVAHLGDQSRKLSGNARNVLFLLSPEAYTVPDENKRYKFELTSTDSDFAYDERRVEKIDLRATGVADGTGADITGLDIKSPIAESTMTGRLNDWADPTYELDAQSTVDLTQTSGIFIATTPIVGVGNFKGKVKGHGESYVIQGNADAESLRAEGVYLKAVNVAATVEGTNSNYNANGTAIAQMLTFDDFRVDFLKLVGNVRGTGTDFSWLGDLQAAAAKTRSVTLGGLFLSDAVAEYKDKQIQANAVSGRAQKFAIGDTEFADLSLRNLKFRTSNGTTTLTAPNGAARILKGKDYSLAGIKGSNLRLKNAGDRTDVALDNLISQTGKIGDANLKNISAEKFNLTDLPKTDEMTATNLRAGRVDSGDTHIDGLEAPEIHLMDDPSETVIYSDKLRVAKIETDTAILGSLNIGGVRLTIRQGRVEAKSGDIDAGTVALKKSDTMTAGGRLENVKIYKPVYVLEPSGRYRVTADMSLGGGALGSVSLGAATTKLDATNDRIALNNLQASVMNGAFNGAAVLAMSDRAQSTFNGDFSNLDLSKLMALQGGRVFPIEGQTTGHVDLTFQGTNFRTASGTLNADITANAGTADKGLIPISGQVKVTGVNELFNVDVANLRSASSTLTASGRFDLNDENSNLAVALKSTDASEIDRIIRVLGISSELEHQLDSMRVQFAGNMSFDGTVTGSLSDPTINGHASLDSLIMREHTVGSVAADLFVSPAGTEIRNGKLQEPSRGNALFTVSIPAGGTNNTAVKATLTNVNAGNLFAALPIDLPEKIRDLDGLTSGTVDVSGLPNNAQGEINLSAAKGIIAGQAFDNVVVKAVFTGTRIDLQRADMQIGAGRFTAAGTYDHASDAFDLDITGKTIPVTMLTAFIPNNQSLPPIKGDVDFTAKATGTYDKTATYNVNFNGAAPNVVVGENSIGQVTFKGNTQNQTLTADLTATFDGHPQVINGSVNLGNENLPFMAATDFNQSPLAPFISFIPQLKDLPITGTGTGHVEFGGNLSQLDDKGNRVYTDANLSGTAQFSQLALQIQDTPLFAAEPISIRFNTKEVVFEKARFSGGGSNMTIAGTKALTENGMNNLSIDGRVNLSLLNLAVKDTFFSGFADASVRLVGPNSTARLSGSANIIGGSIATFVGSDRFTFDRVTARVIFTTNQFEVDDAAGYLGGGKFTGSGGGLLNGLAIQAFRFTIDGNNVTVPLPQDFITTGDAQLEITAKREGPADNLQLTFAGRVNARRSLYSKDIDLASIVSGRSEPNLSSGGGSIAPPRFDIVIEGRNALVVRNNVADLTASVSLALTGDADNPRLAGRITANSGTILFRKDRYEIQRGVLEFPPDTEIDPVINLQAESEIAGYQVFVNLSGPLKDTEELNATVRSSPALPQADVISLITTGNLANTTGGIPTLTTGINTAAEVLTDAIINNPVRKATDKLFGLNVFEIDPLISGQQLNPTARLTVGRQINNRLRVTYSTNLSADQNQVLAVEYRVSNKLSFVAQYEQRSLTNVTRNRDTFSFEVRFRRRF